MILPPHQMSESWQSPHGNKASALPVHVQQILAQFAPCLNPIGHNPIYLFSWLLFDVVLKSISLIHWAKERWKPMTLSMYYTITQRLDPSPIKCRLYTHLGWFSVNIFLLYYTIPRSGPHPCQIYKLRSGNTVFKNCFFLKKMSAVLFSQS